MARKLLLPGKSLKHIVMLLPFQGAIAPTRDTQGVASLALGSVLHWAFSPHLHTRFYYTTISNEAVLWF